MAGLLAAFAEHLAPLVAECLPAADGAVTPWLDSREAAEYLRLDNPETTGRKRVSELARSGALPCARDGTRLLFRREWLDAYLEGRSA